MDVINPGLLRGKPIAGELRTLSPIGNPQYIVVGRMEEEVPYSGQKIKLPAMFEVYPLPLLIAQQLVDDFTAFFKEFLGSNFTCHHSGTHCTQMKFVCHQEGIKDMVYAPDPCGARECPYFTPKSSDTVLEKVIKTNFFPKVISWAVCGTDKDHEFFSANMTLEQTIHAAVTIYEQNYRTERLPEDTRKNVTGLMAMLGFGSQPPTLTPEPMSENVQLPSTPERSESPSS